MSKTRFIESIKVKDGKFCNLALHRERALRTCNENYGTNLDFDLTDNFIPREMQQGLVKCRILYSDTIESIQFEPYSFRTISSLKLVYDNVIDYSYKAEDRQHLQKLLTLKESADEILIVKNGLITDTSFSNVVFENNQGLFTPKMPLLRGVKRKYLLDNGKITEKNISPEDLTEYTSIYLINAMIDIEDNISTGVANIF